jgi:restriction system protein
MFYSKELLQEDCKMANKDITVWGIHAGKTGDAYSLFMKKNVIALGWPKMGDLTQLKGDRDAFKAKLSEVYQDEKLGAIPLDAGQLFRFVYEMKAGDVVVYPSQHDRKIHIGKVEGPYQFNPALDAHYTHIHPVKWLTELPRTSFTQGALYEIGSAMSLFQVKNYAEEYLVALEGKIIPPVIDPTVTVVLEEIEQTTRDFVLKQLEQELKGHPLSHFVAHILEAMGYRTRISPVGPDAGIDIIAHKDELGFEPPIIKVQVKSGEGSVGDPVVSALYGKVGVGEFGLLVTTGTFTNQAKGFARNKTNLRLIDGEELVDLILQHYEQFDPRYKGLIPLKRVYIPESLKEEPES